LTLGFDTPIEKKETKGIYTSISTKLNYGFAEDRLRVMGTITSIQQSKLRLFATGGSSVQQFNQVNPSVKLSTP
jgi:hypothetical protein